MAEFMTPWMAKGPVGDTLSRRVNGSLYQRILDTRCALSACPMACGLVSLERKIKMKSACLALLLLSLALTACVVDPGPYYGGYGGYGYYSGGHGGYYGEHGYGYR
jgi:hypothetical protein